MIYLENIFIFFPPVRDEYIYENIPLCHVHTETHRRFFNFEEILACILLILQQILHIDFLHLLVFTPQILKQGCALSTGKMSVYLTYSN